MITVLHEQRTAELPDASAEDDSLWLNADDVARATGWEWKPEGLCRGDVCMPLPRTGPSLVRDRRLDVAGMWQFLGHPVVHDASGSHWVLGVGERDVRAGIEAPDFELPDLDGRLHRLSGLRGRKVFLSTWASW